jgi:hypothetical protein
MCKTNPTLNLQSGKRFDNGSARLVISIQYIRHFTQFDRLLFHSTFIAFIFGFGHSNLQ